MSFIDDSKQNVRKYTSSFNERMKKTLSLKEVSGGSVAGFVGGKGMGIDALFAGPFHPDSGYGSEIEKLLKKQLKDRKKQRAKMEKETDDYTGTPDPVGGYYEPDTEFARLAYDELEARNQMAIDYSIENTPLADVEWKSTGWNYNYDEIISYIEEKDFINTSETNMENVGIDIKYDDLPKYAGKNFINTSKTNWKIINRG